MNRDADAGRRRPLPPDLERLLDAERLLAVGLVDRAEEVLIAIRDADPRSAPALVGLARVALERDDDEGALRLALEALECDPADEAASRLAERMTEVLAARGALGHAPETARRRPSSGVLGRILGRR